MPQIILASTSRYRSELLERLGLPFTTRAPEAAEDAIDGESPAAMAARLALAKARSIGESRRPRHRLRSSRVARRPAPAQARLRGGRRRAAPRAQGKTVLFHTAVAVIATDSGETLEHVDRTEVQFRRLDVAALEQYVRLERPLDCAGSFKAEGLGVVLFEQVSSQDPTALIGLPLIFVAAALRKLGADPLRP